MDNDFNDLMLDDDSTNERLTSDELDALMADANITDGDEDSFPKNGNFDQEVAQRPVANVPQVHTPASTPENLSYSDNQNKNIQLLYDIYLQVTVELGRKNILIKDVLALGEGSIIELDKPANEPVELLVNDRLVARGEVVVIDENFGVRVTEIVDLKERLMYNLP